MKHRRILSGLAALMLAASLPMSALAKEWYLEDGDITVSATDSGQTVKQGSEDAVDDNDVTITQRDSSTATSSTVTITAEKDQTANVTLKDVNINTGTRLEAAVSTKGQGDVTVELDGSNTLRGKGDHAGLEKDSTGSLEITDNNKDGALTATGGDGSAGIGGGKGNSASNITISGGKVNAIGGMDGAGIGGGALGDGSDITITGGEVTASSVYFGAGIGGGVNGDGNNITIAGGNVTATGGDSGAGIGGGSSGSGSNITVSGGNVTAIGGDHGAGIGGGFRGEAGNITISGDAQVKAQGGVEFGSFGTGAGIGSGGSSGGIGEPPIHGDELTPDTSKLTANGKIEYYAPGADMEQDAPTQTIVGSYVPPQPPAQPSEKPSEKPSQDSEQPAAPAAPAAPVEAPQAAPLYRVTDADGKYVKYAVEWKNGVLTVTAEADFASLTGKLSGIASLKAQGIEKIVFITNGAASEFQTADLLEAGAASDSYSLTHDGENVTFTVGEADVSGILAK